MQQGIERRIAVAAEPSRFAALGLWAARIALHSVGQKLGYPTSDRDIAKRDRLVQPLSQRSGQRATGPFVNQPSNADTLPVHLVLNENRVFSLQLIVAFALSWLRPPAHSPSISYPYALPLCEF